MSTATFVVEDALPVQAEAVTVLVTAAPWSGMLTLSALLNGPHAPGSGPPPPSVAAAAAIVEAVSVLERHPEIGRPAEQGLRELVISRRRTGYVALYSFNSVTDTVLILALRHQKEAGYPEAIGEI